MLHYVLLKRRTRSIRSLQTLDDSEKPNTSTPSLDDLYPLSIYPVDPHISADTLPSLHIAAPSADAADSLQLGIHFHESQELVLSAHFLSISSRLGSPVGMYMFAMALRHGWGCEQDMIEAVTLFEKAANAVIDVLMRDGSGANSKDRLTDSREFKASDALKRRSSAIETSKKRDLSYLDSRYSLDRLHFRESSHSVTSYPDDDPFTPLTATSPSTNIQAKQKRFSSKPSLLFREHADE